MTARASLFGMAAGMLFSCSLAQAQIPQTIPQEINIHVSSKRPAIAVVPLPEQGQRNEKINQILGHGIALTGLFDRIPAASFLPGLAQEKINATQYDKWAVSGAQWLVKSEIIGGKLKLALFDVSDRKRIDIHTPSETDDSRAIYAFLNGLMQYLTGEPGFFGQSLLAVTREGRGKGARVVTMLTDGTNVARATRSNAIEMLPAWGPSGNILLTSYAKNNPDLYLVSHGAGKRIAANPGMNSGASYCPANGKIVLTLSKDGNAEIYTMDADGSNPARLTHNSAIDTSPAWSPDCRKIAFVSDRGGNPQIYTMNADGSNPARLTTIGKYNANPAWGKKGYIAFSARDEQNNLDIFTIKEDGSELTRITQQQGKNDKPTWSPDGRYIAFSSTRDGSSRIYISTFDGKSQNPATTSGWYENPVWGF